MRLSLLSLLLFACGAPPTPAPDPEPIMQGVYGLELSVTGSDGSCGFLEKRISSRLEFDDGGSVVPPVSGVECSTEYPLRIKCEGFGAKLSARALHSGPQGGRIVQTWGHGDITGNVFGCTSVRFEFYLGPVRDP